MKKTLLLLFLTVTMASPVWAAPPPVDNSVPPCSDAPNSTKPSCRMDSDSVNRPPSSTRDRDIVVPPEVPAEGLPNRNRDPGLQPPPPPPPDPVPGNRPVR